MFKNTGSIQSTLLYYKRPGLLGKKADSRAGTAKVQKESGTSCCIRKDFEEQCTHTKGHGNRSQGASSDQIWANSSIKINCDGNGSLQSE